MYELYFRKEYGAGSGIRTLIYNMLKKSNKKSMIIKASN